MLNKLINLVSKYKYFIIFLIIYGIILYVFVPNQKKYYFDDDIKLFKEGTYLKISLILSGIILCITVVKCIISKIKINQIFNVFFIMAFLCFNIFYLMGNSISSFLLYTNRKFAKDEFIKSYEILSISNNKYFSAQNIHSKNDFINEREYYKYSGEKDASNLKNGETITLKLKEGLFGITYFEPK
ncbi:MAG: hypothetical protein J6O88_07220 [Chryseobacterium sp.]|uniref:hypothetical protein n=1 Tax=Chryseobacterium sp. TaxID=1871047 RepID=UPI001B09BC98|nr:hypothetical protein [Chryseobacterium sp.]MBO6184469.1 hypothetical protein [Chryseobacterium sp.]